MVWTCTLGSKRYIKRNNDIGNFDARINEGMFLIYSIKRNFDRFYKQITNIIVQCNCKVDEKFRVKERMFDYYSHEEESNPGPIIENIETFFETKNDVQNDVQIIELTKEQDLNLEEK